MILRALFYASLTVAVMLLVSVAYRREKIAWLGVPGAAIMLLITYAVSNAVDITVGTLPSGMTLFPSIDTACFSLSFMQWYATRQMWSLVLTGLFALEILRHFAYFAGATKEYVLYLNICYVAQLCCVALPSLVKLMGESRSGRAAN